MSNISNVINLILSGYSLTEALEYDAELDEKKVHLLGSQWSKSGNCVVLAGGTGSGKGWVKDNFIAADFQQVFDVDALKDLYISNAKAGKIPGDSGDYDLKNPDDVSKLHQKVKDKKWDKTKFKQLFTSQEKLPNILFDITGAALSKLENIGKQAKLLGYNVVLIWVVTPRQVAIIGNLTRSRIVGQQVFHKTHNDVIESVFNFLDGLADDYDEAFIVFNPGKSVSALPEILQDIVKKYDVVQLVDKGTYFEFPDDVRQSIIDFLGKQDDPEDLKIYKDFKDIDTTKGPSGVYK